MMIYKGYEIDTTTFKNSVTVFFYGDEVAFESVREAKDFIDEIGGDEG